MIQAKLVNPGASPKAIIGTHDRVAIGHEFHLFSHMLGIVAVTHVPTPEITSAGHQVMRMLTPQEVVRRAEDITELALHVASAHKWSAPTPDISSIYDDADASPRWPNLAAQRIPPKE